MNQLPKNPTKEDVLTLLASAANYGNLGLFIGAGFSKAVVNNGMTDPALSWGDLLERVIEELAIAPVAMANGLSYPQIASQLCQHHHNNLLMDNNKVDYAQAVIEFKSVIAELTNYYPDKSRRDEFADYLKKINPAWIITTNYDLVIESLLTGCSVALGPKDSLSSPNDMIPIYHLHGLRSDPEGIIITQEDYVTLFRPNEYRQVKLALTIKESTTLLLGYGLGDVNVLTALDWSKNVFRQQDAATINYPSGVIQVHIADNPKIKPYHDKNGIIVYETKSLIAFFNDYNAINQQFLLQQQQKSEDLAELVQLLNLADLKQIDLFINDDDVRQNILSQLSQADLARYLLSDFMHFFEKCLDRIKERSSKDKAFDEYSYNLAMLIDILSAFSVKQFPPALFQLVAANLNWLANYIGRNKGQSFKAATLWQESKGSLKKEVVNELKSVARLYYYSGLMNLLKN